MQIKSNFSNYYQNQEFQFYFSSLIQFGSVKNQKFLILRNTMGNLNFLSIPTGSYFQKYGNFYTFKYISNTKNYLYFLNFQKNLIHFFKHFNKKFKKQLVIKGLGMRIRYIYALNTLELKLGFSNLIYILVPHTIKVLRSKNLLMIEGSSSVLVGNFSYLIRNLKRPDAYQGKGLWYKNELKKLKPVKKV